MPRIGPYSACATLRKLDGRTREARLVKALRTELIRHVGGSPSVTQRILIDQATELRLRIALMEMAGTEPGDLTERRQVQFLAWTNALSRLLRELGLKAAVTKPPSITEIMSRPSPRAAA